MIVRATSIELNQLVDATISRIDAIERASKERASQAKQYMAILQGISHNLNNISAKTGTENATKSIFVDDIVGGTYTRYKNFIHGKTVGESHNLLNTVSNTGVYHFRDHVSCLVNGEESRQLKEALKHEACDDKQLYYETYDSPELTLAVDIIDDHYYALMDISMIELAPIIGGSFSVKEIRATDAYTNEVFTITSDARNLGDTKYYFDKKITLSKIEMDIELDQQDESGSYVFGLRHLYFLEENLSTDSHMIVKFTYSGNIDTISEKVRLQTTTGLIETTLSDIGAELYLHYENGVFDYEVETSINEEKHHFAVNTNTVYIKLPVMAPVFSLAFAQVTSK